MILINATSTETEVDSGCLGKAKIGKCSFEGRVMKMFLELISDDFLCKYTKSH